MVKNLLLTFDYELYLGNRSGSIKDCMIDPTQELMQVLSLYDIHAIFFVDTTYLLRVKEQAKSNASCAADFETIAGQLRDLVKNGHYIFPHIHPHWLDAKYLPEINEWRLNDVSKYRFHSLSEEERANIFDGSIQILKDILLPQFPEYKIDGYRAGGWCIQPFTDYKPFFEKHEIKYEFSVLGGAFQFTDAQYFDFSNAPEKTVYQFSDDVCSEDVNGPFTQFNISCISIPNSQRFLNKFWTKVLYSILGDKSYLRGEGQPSRIVSGLKPVSSNGYDLANPGIERVCIELMSIVKLDTYHRFLQNNHYMHFISHPKMITKHNLFVFNKFLNKSFEKYQITTDFHKMIPG